MSERPPSSQVPTNGSTSLLARAGELLPRVCDLVAEVDADGVILHITGGLLDRAHFPIERLIGQKLAKVFGREVAEKVSPLVGVVLETRETQQAQLWTSVARKSVELSVELSYLEKAGPADQPGKATALLVARDVTQFSRLVGQLTESEARYRGLMRSFHDLLFIVNRDFIIRQVNTRAADRYGGSSSAWLDKPFDAVFDEETSQTFRRRVNRTFRSGQPSRWQGPLLLFGKQFFFDVIWSPLTELDGRPTQVVTLCRDMTDRVETQKLLREAELRYHTVIDSMDDLVYVVDLDGRVLSANKRMAALLGVAQHELIGQKLATLMPPEWSVHHDRVSAVMNTQQTAEFEARLPLGGKQRVMSIVLSPLKRGGQAAAVVGMARDRTQQRELEEAMYQAQKLETVGQLAGGVAHDFNNLLVGVLSNASFIRKQLPASSTLAGPLELIEKSAQQAAGLVQQLLGFAGRGNRQKQTIDLNPVIHDAVTLWQPQLSGGVKIATDLAADLPQIDADPSQIGQIVMNLLLNAAQSMPSGGTVTLCTIARNAADIRDLLPDWPAEKAVELVVRDQGVGMTHAVIEKIFEPYFTTKKEGRGLGLSAVYGIVQRHRAQIRVSSTPGAGTTFQVFFLPTRTPTRRVEDVHVPTDSACADLPQGGRGVLVLAEDPGVCQQLEAVLSVMGYDAYVATSRKEVEQMLDSLGGRIEVVFGHHSLRAQLSEADQAARQSKAGVKRLCWFEIDGTSFEPHVRNDVLHVSLRSPVNRLAEAIHDFIAI